MRVFSKAACLTILVSVGVMASFAQPTEDKKLPVPDKQAQTRAQALVLDVFGEDLKRAKDAETRSKLAGELLQQGRDSRDDDAVRYVLFVQARELAAQAGDAAQTLLAVEEIGRAFAVNVLDMKATSLATVAESTTNKDAGKNLVDLVLPMVQDAIEADNYEAALAFAKVAEAAARQAKSLALVTSVQKRYQEVILVQKGFARLQGFLDRLKNDPKDAEANYEMGRYYAFLKGRWEKALPLLAASNNAPLKKMAVMDLAAPKEAPQQLALADAWWELANGEEEPAKLSLQRRALHWYEQAVYNLTGLNHTKASKRIDAIRVRLAGVAGEAPAGPVGEIKKLDGHTDEIKSVAFSADGRLGVSGSVDQTVRVWDLVTGKESAVLRGHSKQIWGVAFHPNNRQVFSASWDATARLWDIKSASEVKRFSHRLDLNGLAVSRDGSQLLTGSDDHNAYLWDVATGGETRRFPGHTGFVYRVAFSNDGRLVASGSVDKSVRVYELATGNLVRTFMGHNSAVTQVAFSPDARFVFSCGDDAAHQWEIGTGKEVRRFEGHTGNIPALAVTPDGRRLITGGDDKTIRIWDISSGKEIHRLAGHTDTVSALAVSVDGRHALSGSYDRTVRLWGLPR